tara:strand:+ start:121 stop:408 length:288 start_codon:yes stop_codon:yes gene_type:complete
VQDNRKETMQDIEKLQDQIQMLKITQMTIVEHLSKDDSFMKLLIAGYLANDKLRNSFTEHINENGDDDMKVFMQSMNETALEFKEEYRKQQDEQD